MSAALNKRALRVREIKPKVILWLFSADLTPRRSSPFVLFRNMPGSEEKHPAPGKKSSFHFH